MIVSCRGEARLLRTLLGEPPVIWEGTAGKAVQCMDSFYEQICIRVASSAPDASRYRVHMVRTEGLRRSLEELEESLFAAQYFARRIGHTKWDQLSGQELLDYDRHVYFDKNAYIRTFSLLDKLGSLMNDLLGLRTEEVKPKFSYFTVLRRMRDQGPYAELAGGLTAIKEKHRLAMNRLRARRNMEIHYLNAELKDDLRAIRRAELDSSVVEYQRLEDLSTNMADAKEGWEMVAGTLLQVFQFSGNWMNRTT